MRGSSIGVGSLSDWLIGLSSHWVVGAKLILLRSSSWCKRSILSILLRTVIFSQHLEHVSACPVRSVKILIILKLWSAILIWWWSLGTVLLLATQIFLILIAILTIVTFFHSSRLVLLLIWWVKLVHFIFIPWFLLGLIYDYNFDRIWLNNLIELVIKIYPNLLRDNYLFDYHRWLRHSNKWFIKLYPYRESTLFKKFLHNHDPRFCHNHKKK